MVDVPSNRGQKVTEPLPGFQLLLSVKWVPFSALIAHGDWSWGGVRVHALEEVNWKGFLSLCCGEAITRAG